MSGVIVAVVLLGLTTAMTVYSLKKRGSSSYCRCRCPYDDKTACEATPPGNDNDRKSNQ